MNRSIPHLSQTKSHGTAMQYTGHGVVGSTWGPNRDACLTADGDEFVLGDEGNCQGTPKKCGGGRCYGTCPLSQRTGNGDQGR